MKQIQLIFISLLLSISAICQINCDSILAHAKAFEEEENFKNALNTYIAAQSVCPVEEEEDIRNKVIGIYNRIEEVKEQAVKEKQKAIREKKRAIKAQQETKEALEQIERLSDSNNNALKALEVAQHDPTLGVKMAWKNIELSPEEADVSLSILGNILQKQDIKFYKQSIDLYTRSRITHMALSQNGAFVAVAADNSPIRIWNTDFTNEFRSFRGHTNRISALAFSVDGKKLASGSEKGKVLLWDVNTGNNMTLIHEDTSKQRNRSSSRIQDLSFSQDGSLIAISYNNKTILQDTKTKHIIYEFNDQLDQVIFSPSNTTLAAISADSIFIYDLKSFHKKVLPIRKGSRISTFSFDAKKRYGWVGHDDGTIRRWNIEKKTYGKFIDAHNSSVSSLKITKDGKYLASTSKEETKVWNIAAKPFSVGDFLGHKVNFNIHSCTFSSDDKELITLSHDKTVKKWMLETNPPISSFPNTETIYEKIILSNNGNFLAAYSKKKQIAIWDIPSKKIISILPIKNIQARRMVFSPDDKYFAYASNRDSTIIMWDFKKEEKIEIDHFLGRKNFWSFSPNNKYLILSNYTDSLLNIYDFSTKKIEKVLPTVKDHIKKIAFSPDGKYLATIAASDSLISIWNMDSFLEIASISRPKTINQLSFTTANHHLLVNEIKSNIVYLYDIRTGKTIKQLEYKKGNLNLRGRLKIKTAPSKEYAIIYSTNNRRICFWNIEQDTSAFIFKNVSYVKDIIFSAESEKVFAFSDQNSESWNVLNGKITKIFKSRFRNRDISYSNEILTYKISNAFYIYSLKKGKKLFAINEFNNGLKQMKWINNNKIITLSEDFISIWNVKQEQEIKRFHFKDQPIEYFYISPDHTKLVAKLYDDPFIAAWDININQTLPTPIVNREFSDIIFAPKGNLCATINKRHKVGIMIWDFKTGLIKRTLYPKKLVSLATFSPNGDFLAVGNKDSLFAIWNIDTEPEVAFPLGNTNGGKINNIVFSETSDLVTVSRDSLWGIWKHNKETNEYDQIYSKKESIEYCYYSLDNNLVITTRDNTTGTSGQILDPETGNLINDFFLKSSLPILFPPHSSMFKIYHSNLNKKELRLIRTGEQLMKNKGVRSYSPSSLYVAHLKNRKVHVSPSLNNFLSSAHLYNFTNVHYISKGLNGNFAEYEIVDSLEQAKKYLRSGVYKKQIENFPKALDIIDWVIASDSTAYSKYRLAEHYNTLGWAYLNEGYFKECEATIRKGIKVYAGNDFLITNLIPAIFFQEGRQDEAKKLYMEYKDKIYMPGIDRGLLTYGKVFIKDLKELKGRRIIPKDLESKVDDIIEKLSMK